VQSGYRVASLPVSVSRPVNRQLRELAKNKGQISTAVAAEVKRGELMGYYVQRRENSNVVYTISDKPMSREEWKATYCGGSSVDLDR
jgi:hypothetical protein